MFSLAAPVVFPLQFLHPNRCIKPRSDRLAFHTVARGLRRAERLVAAKHSVDPACGFLAFSDGVHDLPAAICAIATREQAGNIGRSGLGIAQHYTALIELKLGEKTVQ